MSLRNVSPTPKQLLDHLFWVVSGDRFLKMESLNNEVPFFICPFKPEQAGDVAQVKDQLVSKLRHQDVTILEINLYDLAVEILKEREVWDQILEVEPATPKDELKELLQGVLDPEQHLIPAIAKRLDATEFDVLFITGVGEVFPYIRSHNVLNNLQSVATSKPTLMFFPGDYSHSLEGGASLDLFGRLNDDKYYRAFNILHIEGQ